MRYLWLLIAAALLLVQQPDLALAGRAPVRPTAKAKATPYKQARQARVRAASRTRAKHNIRPSSRKARGIKRIGKFRPKFAAAFKMRKAVRGQRSTATTAMRSGFMGAAAKEISRSPLRNAKGQFVKGPKKVSFRERFAIWRTTRAVRNSAMAQAKARSKKGDVEGTADALQALETLESRGKLGMLARWKAARIKSTAIKNISKDAKRKLQQGDLEGAGQSFMFAAEMKGSPKATKKLANTLLNESYSLAATYAKSGKPDLAMSVLQMGAAIAQEGKASFNQAKAEKIMTTAFKKAIPTLTKEAQKAYKAGDVANAAAMLAEARAMERSGQATPTASASRTQAKLMKVLGPRVAQIEGSGVRQGGSQMGTTRNALADGQLSAAAKEVSRSPLRNAKGQFIRGQKSVTFRERFALWRGAGAVKSAAMKQAKARSQKGDVEGTMDALQALETLEAKGKLGMFARWKAARIKAKAIKNLSKSARTKMQQGDLEGAGQSFMFASEMKGSPSATKKLANKLLGESYTLAANYAKAGKPDLAMSVLQMGAAIAQEGKATFNQGKAEKIMNTAFKKAIPTLTKEAQQAYKAGDLQNATALLAEARAIERSGNAVASSGARKAQSRLVESLGPRLMQYEAAMAQQEAAQLAEQ